MDIGTDFWNKNVSDAPVKKIQVGCSQQERSLSVLNQQTQNPKTSLPSCWRANVHNELEMQHAGSLSYLSDS